MLDRLKHNGVRPIEQPIARLEGSGDKLERIRFRDGREIPCDALFFSPGQHQRSHLAEMLEFCEADGCVQCGLQGVPGVYAAGNASRGVQLVITAAAEGMQAGFAINSALLEADAPRGKVLETASLENVPSSRLVASAWQNLEGLNLLDTPPEENFDRITSRLTRLFKVPIALVTLADKDRQWFKSHKGLPQDLQESRSMPRDVSLLRARGCKR